jgi:TP901 family phage tail tape measure protein
MSINIDVHGNTDPLVRDVDAAVKRINRSGGIKIRIDDKGVTQPLGNMKRSADEFTKSLEASNARVLAFGASVGIINAVSDAFKGLVTQTIAVEKNLTDINVVMGLTSKQLDKFGSGLFKVAAETGAGFQAASEAATEFARQGLSVAETLKRTKDALVLTRLTGMKSTEAVKSLTAAMNTFKGEVKDSTQLVSKFAAVDVKFAVSAQDFADAIARAGQAARDAGVDIDQLIGLVTAAQERTARGGAVIGNSFKTIFTRVQRGSTLKELENLGVAVRDLEGKTLPAMKVLQGLAQRYDTLTDAQKSYISQNVAGVFQINILKAAMADLGKANSVTAQATQIASNATDESSKKNEQLRQTMSALAGETGVAIQQLAKSIGDIALAPGINKVLDGVKGMAEFAQGLLGDGEKEGSKFAKGLLAGVGNFLSGPGLVVLTAVVSKLFANAVKYGAQSLSSLLNINKAADQRKSIEQSLMMVMSQNAALSEEMLRTDLSRAEKEKLILNLIKQQTVEAQKLSNISKSMTPGLMRSGVNQNLAYSRSGRAFGFVPNFAAGDEERKRAQAGGYAPGSIKAMSIPGHGPVIYNSAEKVKKFDGMSQPAIMPPSHSKAGKKYRDEFADAHGFDPYASHGFIPNFSIEAIKKFYDSGGKLSKFSRNMPRQNKELLENWQGGKMTGFNRGSGVVHPSSSDIEKYLNKHGTNSQELKSSSAPVVARAKSEKDRKEKARIQEKIGDSINLSNAKYGIKNLRELGVMLGSGNQSTMPKTYYQPFSGLSADNQQYLISKQFPDFKTDKQYKNATTKKYKTLQEFKNKKVSVTLPTRALYPTDPSDTADMGKAIGKSQLNTLFKNNLGPGMDSLANSIFTKMFPGQSGNITNAVDFINNNNSIRGGILESGIDAALGGDPKGNSNRSFDFVGNQAKTIAGWMGNQALKKIELKITDEASESGKLPNKTINQLFGMADGFVPNFADPLRDAIGREKEAGIPVSKIRVGTHKALIDKSNPMGLGVTNTDDEPRGLKDVFGSNGHVPNYAIGDTKVGKFFGSVPGITEANEAAKDAAKAFEKTSKTLERTERVHKALEGKQNRLKKEVEENRKIMNDRNASGKQRQAAAKKFLTSQAQLTNTTNSLARAHKRNGAASIANAAAQKADTKARNTATRRQKMSQNRGMVGISGMMGMSMLAGQLEQSGGQGARNAAGALNGASMGASIGMMFGPWGTAIGGAVGALNGFINSTKEAEKALKSMEMQALVQAESNLLNKTNTMFESLVSSKEGRKALDIEFEPSKMKDQRIEGSLDYFKILSNRGVLNTKQYGADSEMERLKDALTPMKGSDRTNDLFKLTKQQHGNAALSPKFLEYSNAALAQVIDNPIFKNYNLEDETTNQVPTLEFNNTDGKDEYSIPQLLAATTRGMPNPNKNGQIEKMLVTPQGLEFGSELNTENRNEYETATRELIKILENTAEAMKPLESGDYSQITVKMTEFKKQLDGVPGELKTLGDAFSMSNQKLAELNSQLSLDKDGSNKDAIDKEINALNNSRAVLVKEFINNLSDDYSQIISLNGKDVAVNKEILKQNIKNSKNLGVYNDTVAAIANIAVKQANTVRKENDVMERSLSQKEVSLKLQKEAISIQSKINQNMLAVKARYAFEAARIGKSMSFTSKAQNEYNKGIELAGYKRQAAEEKMLADFQSKVIGGFLQEPQMLATYKEQHNLGSDEEVINRLRGLDASDMIKEINTITGLDNNQARERAVQLKEFQNGTKVIEDNFSLERQKLIDNKIEQKINENRRRILENMNSVLGKTLYELESEGRQRNYNFEIGNLQRQNSRIGASTIQQRFDYASQDANVANQNQIGNMTSDSLQRQIKLIEDAGKLVDKDLSGNFQQYLKDPTALSGLASSDGTNLAEINKIINALNKEKTVLEENIEHKEEINRLTLRQLELQKEITTGPRAFANGFDSYARAAEDRVSTFKYELGKAVPQAFASNMSAAMMKVIREGGSLKEAMIDGLIGALDTINQKFMENWMDHLFSGFTPDATSGDPMAEVLNQTKNPLMNLATHAGDAAGGLKHLVTELNKISFNREEQYRMNGKTFTRNSNTSTPYDPRVAGNQYVNPANRQVADPKQRLKLKQGPNFGGTIAGPGYINPMTGKLADPKQRHLMHLKSQVSNGNVNPNGSVRNPGLGQGKVNLNPGIGPTDPNDPFGIFKTQNQQNAPVLAPATNIQKTLKNIPGLTEETIKNVQEQYDSLPSENKPTKDLPKLQLWDWKNQDGPTTSTSTSTTSTSTTSAVQAFGAGKSASDSERAGRSVDKFYNRFTDTGMSNFFQDPLTETSSTSTTTVQGASIQDTEPVVTELVSKQEEVIQTNKEQTETIDQGFMNLADKFQEFKDNQKEIDAKIAEKRAEQTAMGIQHEAPPQSGDHVNPQTGQYADPQLRKAQMEQVDQIFMQAQQKVSEAMNKEAMERNTQTQQISTKVGELQLAVGQVIQQLGALTTALQMKVNEINSIMMSQSISAPAPAPGKKVYGGGMLKRRGGGDVPAKVSNGEFVMNRDTVKRLGVADMSILNTGQVPRKYNTGGKPKIWDSSRINSGELKDSFGQGAASMALGAGLASLFQKDKKGPQAWSRPKDYFERNPTWKKRNMSKEFMLNDRRVGEEVQAERAKSNQELQNWIAKMNKRQALGRQVVGLVGNVAMGAAMEGFTDDKTGSFMGLSNEKFKFGGKFQGGEISGTPGIDQIPTMLSEGEYVINARAARQIGMPALERINAGKFNQGGLVGDSTGKNLETSSGSGDNNINITVNVSSDNSSKENMNQDGSPETQDRKKGAEELSKKIKQEVITIIKEENRPGGLLR